MMDKYISEKAMSIDSAVRIGEKSWHQNDVNGAKW